jgi:D-glycero-D-manno-heptose 1,7-bisphosphate phosphatase
MTNALSAAVFVDRDGTIIEDRDYCSDPNDVKIFPGAPEALRRLKSNGFKLIIITNQSGIGRGLFTLEQYQAVEAEVLRQMGNGLIDATYFCPDTPDQHCDCRKPAAGMIFDAAREHQLDLSRSFLIGDKETDVECGHNAGVRTIRVKTGAGRDTGGTKADWVVGELPAAAEIILQRDAMTARHLGATAESSYSDSLQGDAHPQSDV